jgi:hypothetical protein
MKNAVVIENGFIIIENMTDVEIFPKNLKCNFDHKYDKKLMDKICNKNCNNVVFTTACSKDFMFEGQ